MEKLCANFLANLYSAFDDHRLSSAVMVTVAKSVQNLFFAGESGGAIVKNKTRKGKIFCEKISGLGIRANHSERKISFVHIGDSAANAFVREEIFRSAEKTRNDSIESLKAKPGPRVVGRK